MNLINIIENIPERIISEEEEKNNSFYEKCFNLKSPMDFKDNIGTIEDIEELIEFLMGQVESEIFNNKIKNSITKIPPQKSTHINFV